MPTPDFPPSANEVESAIRALDRELRRLRISGSRRAELVEEVRADLRAAAADGVAPQDLLGDVETFAREAVGARGWASRPRDPARGPGLALLAGVAAIVVAYSLVAVVSPFLSLWIQLDGHHPVAGALLVYVLLGTAGLGGALVAFARMLAGRPAARPTMRRAVWWLPIGAALGIVAAVWFGRSQGYPTSAPVIAVEILLVAVPCAAALWLARWWGLRAADPDPERVSAG